MKSINVEKKGWYYDNAQKKTLFLEEGTHTINDDFAKLVIDHKGGEYCDPKDTEESEVDEAMDYSGWDLTEGAMELAKEKELSAEFMDQVIGTGTNGRITKGNLDDEMVEDFDEGEQ